MTGRQYVLAISLSIPFALLTFRSDCFARAGHHKLQHPALENFRFSNVGFWTICIQSSQTQSQLGYPSVSVLSLSFIGCFSYVADTIWQEQQQTQQQEIRLRRLSCA